MAQHGKKKFVLSEQQKAEQDSRERKALAMYNAVMAKLIALKHKHEYEASDIDCTRSVLLTEPRASFVWGFRRRVIDRIKRNANAAELDAVCGKELDFIFDCLEVDPKAYCVWNHRLFIVNIRPTKDFPAELALTEHFLGKDDRNFHCWNYRRDILNFLTDDRELVFTDQKIEKNYTNFSAWHHRCVVLSRSFPRLLDQEDFVAGEFDKLHNGIYTDPSSESLWIYFKWMLCCRPPSCKPVPFLASVRAVGQHQWLLVSVKNPTDSPQDHISITDDDGPVFGLGAPSIWKADANYAVLRYRLPDTVKNRLVIVGGGLRLALDVTDSPCYVSELSSYVLGYLNQPVRTLSRELEVIRDLVTMERHNRWALLSCIELMCSLDLRAHHEEILQLFAELTDIDSDRKGFYLTLKSEIATKNEILTSIPQKGPLLDENIHLLVEKVSGYKQIFVHFQNTDIIHTHFSQ